jgi:hypothetical protein
VSNHIYLDATRYGLLGKVHVGVKKAFDIGIYWLANLRTVRVINHVETPSWRPGGGASESNPRPALFNEDLRCTRVPSLREY